MSNEHNSRIAKNTILLYIRMLLIMAISLYTSRIVLSLLGVSDFGVFNVVGGFVAMFGVLNNSMATATQRFLSFEIGKNDYENLKSVFSTSLRIHILLALIAFVLAETAGFWFIIDQLTIPDERLSAAKWVYHFSILALCLNIVTVPYNAAIFAHEKVNIFAWIGLFDVVLKLSIVFLLQLFGYDKLKLYAVLTFCVTFIMQLIFVFYCRRNFEETRTQASPNKALFKTLISYAGWNLWGDVANILCAQGVNILLNIFFGPTINAARGIAYQVRGTLTKFTKNFQVAINPQIVKSYATGDIVYSHKLIIQGTKYSFFLLFSLSLPILFEAEIILKVWLNQVPEYTAIFLRLILINILIESLSGLLSIAAQASGKVKVYQGVVGTLLLSILPISYVFLKLGYSPEITLLVGIVIEIVVFIARLMLVKGLIALSIGDFIKGVITKTLPVVIIAAAFPLFLKFTLQTGYVRSLLIGFFSVVSSLITIYFVGLENNERNFLKSKLRLLKEKIL